MNEETNEERKTNEKNILIITYELFIGSCQHILFIYFFTNKQNEISNFKD